MARSQAFRIRGDLEQRLRGGTKQEVVHDALVAEREARERLRHREDNVDVADGQELRSRAATQAFRAAVRHFGQCRSRQLL